MWGMQRAPLILKTACLGDWIGEEFIAIVVAAEGFLRNETPKKKEPYGDTQLVTSQVTMADG